MEEREGESDVESQDELTPFIPLPCIAGYLRSSAPRITTGSRIALFHSIFLLTTEMNRVDVSSALAQTHLVFPPSLTSFVRLFASFFY